jgi:hypothetical protein
MGTGGGIKVRASADLTNLLTESRKAREGQEALAKAFGVTRGEVSKAQRALQAQTAAASRVAPAARSASVGTAQLAGAMKTLVPATAAATAQLSALGVASTVALGPIGLVVGTVAAIGVGAFKAAGEMSAFVDKVSNAAEAAGSTRQGYLAFREAIAKSGGDAEKAAQALRKFAVNTDLAGLSAEGVDLALRVEIDRINGIAGAADRAAERVKVFGERGAEAVAGLTGAGLAKAYEEVESITAATNRAAGASTEWDRAFQDLARAGEEFTVSLGAGTTPVIVRITDAVTGTINALNRLDAALNTSSVSWVVWWATAGPIITPLAYIWDTATKDTTRLIDKQSSLKQKLEDTARAGAELRAALAHSSGSGEGIGGAVAKAEAALAERRAKAGNDAAKRNAALEREAFQKAQARAAFEESLGQKIAAAAITLETDKLNAVKLREQAELNEATKAFDRMLELGMGEVEATIYFEELKRIATETATRERMAIVEGEAAEKDRLANAAVSAEKARLAELANAEARLRDMRKDAALQGVSGLVMLAESASKSAEAIRIAKILEIVLYQGVAFARSFAELGPIAGIPAAFTTAGLIGGYLAQANALPSRHMGSFAPDEGTFKVRNGERATIEPATAKREPRNPAMTLTIGSRAFEALASDSGRQSAIFGNRRRKAR